MRKPHSLEKISPCFLASLGPEKIPRKLLYQRTRQFFQSRSLSLNRSAFHCWEKKNQFNQISTLWCTPTSFQNTELKINKEQRVDSRTKLTKYIHHSQEFWATTWEITCKTGDKDFPFSPEQPFKEWSGAW